MFKGTSNKDIRFASSSVEQNSLSENVASVKHKGFSYTHHSRCTDTVFQTVLSLSSVDKVIHPLPDSSNVVNVALGNLETAFNVSTEKHQNQLVEYLESQILPIHDSGLLVFDPMSEKIIENTLSKIKKCFKVIKTPIICTNEEKKPSFILFPKVNSVIKKRDGQRTIRYLDGTLYENTFDKSTRVFSSGIIETGQFAEFLLADDCYTFIQGKRRYTDGQVRYIFPADAKTIVDGDDKCERLANKIREKVDQYFIYRVIFRNSSRLECVKESRSYPTFEPYEVNVEGGWKSIIVINQESHKAFLRQLDQEVNDLHRAKDMILIGRVIKGKSCATYDIHWTKRFKKSLVAHFHISSPPTGYFLSLTPKRVKKEKIGDRTMIHYQNEVVFEYSKTEDKQVFGKRTFPDGNIEEGEFRGTASLIFTEGVLTEGKTKYYMFKKDVYSVFTKKGIFPLNNWKGTPSWKVFKIESEERGIYKCTLHVQSIESLLLENLEKIYEVFVSDALNDKMRKDILPLLFVSSVKYPTPPIFAYTFDSFNYFVLKAIEWGLPIDFNISKKEETVSVPLIIHWVKQHTIFMNKENKELFLSALKKIDRKFFDEHAEVIFITFAKKKKALAENLTYPFDTFSPVGKFIYKLIYDFKISEDDMETVQLFKREDLTDITLVANTYKKEVQISFIQYYYDSQDHKSHQYFHVR